MRKIKSLKIFFISILLIALFLLYPVNILFSDTSSLRIDPTTEFQRYPDICGENVVWMDKRSGETEIYIYNTNSGISGPVFSDGNKQIEPAIYENLVVWSENVSDSSDPVYQVFLYNLLTPDIEPIRIAPTDFDQLQADIYGDKIVWEDFRFGSENTQIYSYDISTEAITRINPTTSSQISPHIYENKIVWSDNIDNAATDFYKYQAYLFDIDTSLITRIDPFNSRQDVTSIYQNKIVYSDTRNADISQVYIYDITTNSSSRLYPTFGYQYGAKISGNKVIWLENYQIYIYDIAAGGMAARVDPTSYNQLYPDIYSDSIVWEDERDLHNNKQQIYIQSLPLVISPSVFESFFARIASIIRNPVFVRDDMATKLSRMLLPAVNKIINIYNAFTGNNVRQIIDFPILDGSNPYENRELEILEEDKIDGAETEKEEETEEETEEEVANEEPEEIEEETGSTEKDEDEEVLRGNNTPVVNDIVFSNPLIVPGLKYDVTAIAVDPDGDSLTYKWTVTGGMVSDDTANPMVWTAPNIEGNYGVSVMVEDQDGEWDARIEWVDVMYRQIEMSALLSMDFPIVPSESGWIERNGEVYNNSDVYGLYVGDSDQNKNISTFISFDITGFPGGTVQDVIFTFNFPWQNGVPSFYDYLYIYVVDWGPRELVAEDYFMPVYYNDDRWPYSQIENGPISDSNELLKEKFMEAVEQGKSRFQIRCELQSNQFTSQFSTDNDNTWDVRISPPPPEVSLRVTYSP